MAYDFHYTPTGTGVISGKEVLEQTEDAINDLGNTAISGVQEALDKAEQALTNSADAVNDAQTALNTANNAEGVAIQAQNDVSNLSGTVTNIGNRVTTAEGNISNLQGRMTTAEGNITNLQGRMTTAEGNIGNLQTAVSTAQATANSAQQTATTARQQSYVFRYSSTAITNNSTIAYSTIDNTDNIKVGDKILDVDGKLFEITAVDTTNQTVTVGSALVDLALDSNVVHTSGDETVGGQKTFTSLIRGYNSDSTQNTVSIDLRSSKVTRGNTQEGTDTFGIGFRDKYNSALMSVSCVKRSTGTTTEYHTVNTLDNSDNVISVSYSFNLNKDGTSSLQPEEDDQTFFGSSSKRWKTFNGLTPSSLSLPCGTLVDQIDISSYFANTGSGETNSYTASANGWIYLYVTSCKMLAAYIQNGTDTIYSDYRERSSDGQIRIMLPIQNNNKFASQWITSTTVSITKAVFIPCQGNV